MVVQVPIPESKEDDLVQHHPEAFTSSVLTSAQARKQAPDVDMSNSLFAFALPEESTVPPGGELVNCIPKEHGRVTACCCTCKVTATDLRSTHQLPEE